LGARRKLQRRGASRDEEHYGGEGREILGDHRRLISLQGPEDKQKRRAGVIVGAGPMALEKSPGACMWIMKIRG
jgi:hypothetical protein